MPAPDEFQIQRAVCIYLDRAALPDVEWWHTPNGGKRGAFEAKRLKQIGVKPGIHDLLFLRAGGLYGLELKDADGVISDAQRARHKRMLACGMVRSDVVDNLADARHVLFQWGLTTTPL